MEDMLVWWSLPQALQTIQSKFSRRNIVAPKLA
jgi:hypothetical protein